MCFQAVQHEVVDGIAGPGGVPNTWHAWLVYGLEGPPVVAGSFGRCDTERIDRISSPASTRSNPCSELCFLWGAEWPPGWHPVASHIFPQSALVGPPRVEHIRMPAARQRCLTSAQIKPALGLRTTVAGETALDQKWGDRAVEIRRRWLASASGRQI